MSDGVARALGTLSNSGRWLPELRQDGTGLHVLIVYQELIRCWLLSLSARRRSMSELSEAVSPELRYDGTERDGWTYNRQQHECDPRRLL